MVPTRTPDDRSALMDRLSPSAGHDPLKLGMSDHWATGAGPYDWPGTHSPV